MPGPVALLLAEEGAEIAIARGQAGLLSAVSYSEVLAKALDRNVPQETATRALDALRLTVVPFDQVHAATTAFLRPATRALEFSFADRACLATAALAQLPIWTADRDWSKVDLGLEIIQIR